MFKTLCKKYNIKKIRTTSYNPQSNGKIERLHRTIKESLRCLGDNHNWLNNLPQTVLGLRNTPNSITNKSSSQNIFKHIPNILTTPNKQTNKNPQITTINNPKPILKTHKETEYMVSHRRDSPPGGIHDPEVRPLRRPESA